MNRRQSDHLMMIIISLTILIIILTYFIEINSVVHGQGVITTKDNAQLISLSKGGTIQDIYVAEGNDSNLLIVFYVQIMPDDFVMQLHRF